MQLPPRGGVLPCNMMTTQGSPDDAQQDVELNTLLAHAPRYTPAEGFAERVLAALHDEELPLPHQPRPWYLRPYSWASAAAAACLMLVAGITLLAEGDAPLPAESLAVDDTLLVDEALDCIDDPDLISAICSVSAGAYSISTGSGAY